MVKINGQPSDADGKSIAEYLAGTQYSLKRIAVELNGRIAPKAKYGETILKDGDVL